MHALYTSSNDLLQFCRLGYIFSDYFVYIKNEKEEQKLDPIRIIEESNKDGQVEAAGRLSPFLSSSNVAVKVQFNNEIIEDEPYYILPITVIETLVVRDENERIHLKALLTGTILEKKTIIVETESFSQIIESQSPISSDEEPFYHPIIRILDGLTAAFCNLFLADFGKIKLSQNPLLSTEFANIAWFPNEVHSHLQSICTTENASQSAAVLDLFRNLKTDIKFLIDNIKSNFTVWFYKGNDYNKYYNQESKVFELYTTAEIDPDLAVISYLGHVLLTRLAIGESGKNSILQILARMADQIDPKRSSLEQVKKVIQQLTDLAKANINRTDFEMKIIKGTTMKSPLEKGLYLFFKHFDDDTIDRLDDDLNTKLGSNLSSLSIMLPYMLLGFIQGFGGFSPNLKKCLLEKHSYCLIWPLHVLHKLCNESNPKIFRLPAAMAIEPPFCLRSIEGQIDITATQNANTVFKMDATIKYKELHNEIGHLEAELAKAKTQLNHLSNERITFKKNPKTGAQKSDHREKTSAEMNKPSKSETKKPHPKGTKHNKDEITTGQCSFL